ncbi:hypothetical protein BU23DRAFT_602939 [Bimuria novae-zelandiae CBS 107.79]|uniref:Uncharacterized protein n=1 Tax=Bimuria novae-zelandiae CBS 107.79 TaxID=1447943 RepID=A0A6A5UWY2_9PLEO|nr:hypothetical protein BU23DRAFT_602939 [Bimuria novae-zelandiae CBS 107.79]
MAQKAKRQPFPPRAIDKDHVTGTASAPAPSTCVDRKTPHRTGAVYVCAMSLPPTTSSNEIISTAGAPSAYGEFGKHVSLGDVHNTGDIVASPNYASRVNGHVLNLGEGEINIETSNSHNYSLAAGAILSVNAEPKDDRFKVCDNHLWKFSNVV